MIAALAMQVADALHASAPEVAADLRAASRLGEANASLALRGLRTEHLAALGEYQRSRIRALDTPIDPGGPDALLSAAHAVVRAWRGGDRVQTDNAIRLLAQALTS